MSAKPQYRSTSKRPVVFHGDLEKLTKTNSDYRNVLFTGSSLQLVLMCLKPGENISLEVHDDHDQFLRVDSGKGYVLAGTNSARLKEYRIKDGTGMIIPAGVHHMVANTSKKHSLKLYSIYSPPEHRHGRVDHRMPTPSKINHH